MYTCLDVNTNTRTLVKVVSMWLHIFAWSPDSKAPHVPVISDWLTGIGLYSPWRAQSWATIKKEVACHFNTAVAFDPAWLLSGWRIFPVCCPCFTVCGCTAVGRMDHRQAGLVYEILWHKLGNYAIMPWWVNHYGGADSMVLVRILIWKFRNSIPKQRQGTSTW